MKHEITANLHVPTWPELAVKHVWPLAIRFPEFVARVPDEWDGGTRTDRTFLFSILFLVSEEFVIQLITDCRVQRMDRARDKLVTPNFMGLHPEVAKMLLDTPFESKCKFVDRMHSFMFIYI